VTVDDAPVALAFGATTHALEVTVPGESMCLLSVGVAGH
jgi:hypothetical protein